MNDHSLKNYVEPIALMEKATLEAAKHLLMAATSPKDISVRKKADHTLVMNLDIECQKIILDILGKKLPVVAEEDESSHKLAGSKTDYFVVDPIDGTSSCKRYLQIEGGHLGFGPLIGLVESGKLRASTFYNLPSRTIYTAIHGAGCFAQKFIPSSQQTSLPDLEARRRLPVVAMPPLCECGVIFFPGSKEELAIAHHLRATSIVENVYRFGGFANDAVRLAEGFEQINIQFKIRAWDFSAALFPIEVGLKAVIDPTGEKTDFTDWIVSNNNPLVMSHPGVSEELMQHVDAALGN